MGRLDAHTDIRIGQDGPRTEFRVKVSRVLLKITNHPLIHDINERKDAGFGEVDNCAFKM